MVILKQLNIFAQPIVNISTVKLHQSVNQFKELALIYCVLFLKYKMPSLPQAAFAVCKIREQSGRSSKTPDDMGGSFQSMEYSPVKYNEKFMNAIWGHYNRYSPHNIKSNDAAIAISTNGKNLMQIANAAAASIQPKSFI